MLVDTTVWIDPLRGRSTPAVARLKSLLVRAGGLIHADAGSLYVCCRWAGITPRSPHEWLIAQTTIDHGVSLLHDDRDFEFIAQVEGQLVQKRG